jgi:hypothetical protein
MCTCTLLYKKGIYIGQLQLRPTELRAPSCHSVTHKLGTSLAYHFIMASLAMIFFAQVVRLKFSSNLLDRAAMDEWIIILNANI